MTATTVYSDNVTNITTAPITALDRKKGKIKTIIDTITVATTSVDEADDAILCGPIPSNAVILDVLTAHPDLDTDGSPALAADIGLAYSGIGGTQAKNGNTIGTAADVDCIATATTAFQSAATAWVSHRFEVDTKDGVADEAWAVAGLSEDPGGLLLLSITVTTAATADGSGAMAVRIDYI